MAVGLNENECICGTVEHITYHNSANGFTVMELKTKDDLFTAVGNMPPLTIGEEVELTGHFNVHSNYGPQFKVDTCILSMPSSSSSVLRYLSSGAIKGVGPATARRIVERFGESTLNIIEENPERLSEIKGVSKEKAIKISDEFKQQFGIREVIVFLNKYKISPQDAMRIYKCFGNKTKEYILNNPYVLCDECIGFSFDRAEKIAAELGVASDSASRIGAGIEYVLRHNLANGHTCLPREKLMSVSAKMLECEMDAVDTVCDDYLNTMRLSRKIIDEKEFVFLTDIYKSEEYCAARLSAMLKFPPQKNTITENEIDNIEKSIGIKYAMLQREAISVAIEKGLLILTGGPGTGKTTTLNAIIKILESKNFNIVLAAPTGRAAKRMIELTGVEAKTIHRLLEVEWAENDKAIFSRCEKNPLDCDVVIIDELSMVDITLFESLLRALRLGCRLIMVGDSNQLPSVGAGNVLYDLLTADKLPSVRLTEVFRQSLKSMIVSNAHSIVKGEEPNLDCRTSDFFMLEQPNPIAAARTTVDLCVNRLTNAYGLSPLTDIQVLCPSKKYEMGSINLNNMLQSKLNSPSTKVPQISFKGFVLRQGDKVMQTKNNYDIVWTKPNKEQGTGIFNGDVGIIETIDIRNGSFSVKYDDRTAVYTGEEVGQLELAYAMTIHKSQGSEFECVVLPLMDMPSLLRYRNLLYTAVTRAKKLLVIVGSKKVVFSMAKNNRKTLRYTALYHMLKELI